MGKTLKPHSCCMKAQTQIQYSFAEPVAASRQSGKTWVDCMQKISWLVKDQACQTRTLNPGPQLLQAYSNHSTKQSYGILYFGDLSSLYAKTNARLSVKKRVIHMITVTWESVFHSLEPPYDHTPKMMLPALWTSCLKDSNTNFQSNIGIGVVYFRDLSRLYAKHEAASYIN